MSHHEGCDAIWYDDSLELRRPDNDAVCRVCEVLRAAEQRGWDKGWDKGWASGLRKARDAVEAAEILTAWKNVALSAIDALTDGDWDIHDFVQDGPVTP